MFLLKIVITARPRILLITSSIPIGLTPGFLSKRLSLDAKKSSSDPLFPQYLFKHNFFAMSAIGLQRSRLLSPNNDEVRMRRQPFSSRFDGPVAFYIYVQFYISGHRLLLSMHILHIILLGRVVDSHRILEKINGLFIS